MLRPPEIGKWPVLLRIAECPGGVGGCGQLGNDLGPDNVYSCLLSFTLGRHSLRAGQDQMWGPAMPTWISHWLRCT